ncbi:hypothetical protein HMI49_08285 [Corallococcus exercitus]|uniref:site-specific DNA-methyltransferase (adenine-specific) n=1 Tax=Corallococcus exercitus TaxID=2316736 RepID=A0A7Y4NRJ0_9BACT|nr:hypothetical protein [Corallococcus exercitus]NOK33188.1 hypothetical protein [Corallococcus exercitus]
MPLSLPDCSFFGPAMPDPFVKLSLEAQLKKAKLLPKTTGSEGKALEKSWEVYRRKLRSLGEQGGALRVQHHVLEPLRERLGYGRITPQETVRTREGDEPGGVLFETDDGGTRLRAWAVDVDTDLDAPSRRGRAFRFSPAQAAQRVLLAQGERLGLLTDGLELRLLVCDPIRTESHVMVRLDRTNGWRGSAKGVPDSYRLVLALASPAGLAKLPDFLEAARLSQTQVTEKLREQARRAVEGFVQEVLDQPGNAVRLAERSHDTLARDLWHEGLLVVYRLLFILKLEAESDPSRAFSFASQSIWRNAFSPNTSLGPHAESVLAQNMDTGRLLEDGLRALFRMFQQGLSSSELKVSPLGGMLFGDESTRLLDRLAWGERGVAILLDRLLWTVGDGKAQRQRVHYGALDVEDLGRVYEALLELVPGIATEDMVRLRRDKLEVVLPLAAAEAALAPAGEGTKKKSKIERIEEVKAGRFFLRVGLGRKSTGAYYTPTPFVRFLVQEALEEEVERRSPTSTPNPAALLKLKVLDPAMGSGHFLVEACRYLGAKLYEACRLCDERAVGAEERAAKARAALLVVEESVGKARNEKERLSAEAQRAATAELYARAEAEAVELRKRVELLPDPNDELLAYLPSRVVEGEESGVSAAKAQALCRRLVAVHCLYGVDKNPLAVELAKVSLWLESYAEGLPLTFLDHRLVCGDSVLAPDFDRLLTTPGKGAQVSQLLRPNVVGSLQAAFNRALAHVHELEASVGKDVADVVQKQQAKARLDAALQPFRVLAQAWAGGAMLGAQSDDAGYEALVGAVAEGRDVATALAAQPALERMLELGRSAFPYELEFPEVFFPSGKTDERRGFDAVVGNPPWDRIQPAAKEFFASYDLRILDAPTKRERKLIEQRLLSDAEVRAAYDRYVAGVAAIKSVIARRFVRVGRKAGGKLSGTRLDIWQVFAERSVELLRRNGRIGVLLPSSFHANESATGIRELYLMENVLKCCFSFENVRKLFEIDSRLKFAAVVVEKAERPTREFECAFYLRDLDWLSNEEPPLKYSLAFVRSTGGEHLSFLELRSPKDTEVARQCFGKFGAVGAWLLEHHVRLGEEMNMTHDSHLFTPATHVDTGEDSRDPVRHARLVAQGYLPLHEGKTFHQFDDRWEEPPRYIIAREKVVDTPAWLARARFYRLAFRDIARSTDERTGIFCLLPPGFLFGNKAPSERTPQKRPNSAALVLLATVNTFSFDFSLRTKVAATVNLFILKGCPIPELAPVANQFLSHGALRLSCNHDGYLALWREQVGNAWREKGTATIVFPAVSDQDDRWAIRAAIDSIVAHGYGLSRDQYEHVLASFPHTSYASGPEKYLAAYDELDALGLEAFCRKYDPYFDIPLNENLPKPLLNFPELRGVNLDALEAEAEAENDNEADDPEDEDDPEAA